MKKGDIVFVRGRGLISSAVRLFDGRGEFSHVAVAVSENHVIEASSFQRVQINPMSHKDYEIVDLELTPYEQNLIVHLAIELIGKWYDYRLIFAIMFSREFHNPNALICTELVLALLIGLGRLEYDPRIHKPNELYRFLTN